MGGGKNHHKRFNVIVLCAVLATTLFHCTLTPALDTCLQLLSLHSSKQTTKRGPQVWLDLKTSTLRSREQSFGGAGMSYKGILCKQRCQKA